MDKTLTKVSDFMATFSQPILDTPAIPTADRVSLRLSLILEELDELAHAAGASRLFEDLLFKKHCEVVERIVNLNGKEEVPNLTEVLDALLDIRYVADGAVNEFGMAKAFDEGFDEVHSSNMSKACPTLLIATETVEQYFNKENLETFIYPHNGLFLIMRKSDKKVLKSKDYSPANLKPILDKYL
jgi:predicted HAD superfamily Cof-like phosphohydrolase